MGETHDKTHRPAEKRKGKIRSQQTASGLPSKGKSDVRHVSGQAHSKMKPSPGDYSDTVILDKPLHTVADIQMAYQTDESILAEETKVLPVQKDRRLFSEDSFEKQNSVGDNNNSESSADENAPKVRWEAAPKIKWAEVRKRRPAPTKRASFDWERPETGVRVKKLIEEKAQYQEELALEEEALAKEAAHRTAPEPQIVETQPADEPQDSTLVSAVEPVNEAENKDIIIPETDTQPITDDDLTVASTTSEPPVDATQTEGETLAPADLPEQTPETPEPEPQASHDFADTQSDKLQTIKESLSNSDTFISAQSHAAEDVLIDVPYETDDTADAVEHDLAAEADDAPTAPQTDRAESSTDADVLDFTDADAEEADFVSVDEDTADEGDLSGFELVEEVYDETTEVLDSDLEVSETDSEEAPQEMPADSSDEDKAFADAVDAIDTSPADDSLFDASIDTDISTSEAIDDSAVLTDMDPSVNVFSDDAQIDEATGLEAAEEDPFLSDEDGLIDIDDILNEELIDDDDIDPEELPEEAVLSETDEITSFLNEASDDPIAEDTDLKTDFDIDHGAVDTTSDEFLVFDDESTEDFDLEAEFAEPYHDDSLADETDNTMSDAENSDDLDFETTETIDTIETTDPIEVTDDQRNAAIESDIFESDITEDDALFSDSIFEESDDAVITDNFAADTTADDIAAETDDAFMADEDFFDDEYTADEISAVEDELDVADTDDSTLMSDPLPEIAEQEAVVHAPQKQVAFAGAGSDASPVKEYQFSSIAKQLIFFILSMGIFGVFAVAFSNSFISLDYLILVLFFGLLIATLFASFSTMLVLTILGIILCFGAYVFGFFFTSWEMNIHHFIWPVLIAACTLTASALVSKVKDIIAANHSLYQLNANALEAGSMQNAEDDAFYDESYDDDNDDEWAYADEDYVDDENPYDEVDDSEDLSFTEETAFYNDDTVASDYDSEDLHVAAQEFYSLEEDEESADAETDEFIADAEIAADNVNDSDGDDALAEEIVFTEDDLYSEDDDLFVDDDAVLNTIDGDDALFEERTESTETIIDHDTVNDGDIDEDDEFMVLEAEDSSLTEYETSGDIAVSDGEIALDDLEAFKTDESEDFIYDDDDLSFFTDDIVDDTEDEDLGEDQFEVLEAETVVESSEQINVTSAAGSALFAEDFDEDPDPLFNTAELQHIAVEEEEALLEEEALAIEQSSAAVSGTDVEIKDADIDPSTFDINTLKDFDAE